MNESQYCWNKRCPCCNTEIRCQSVILTNGLWKDIIKCYKCNSLFSVYYGDKQIVEHDEVTIIKNRYNMKTLKITPPKGWEVDKEKSTSKEIVYKEKKSKLPKSWEGLERVKGYYTGANSDINEGNYGIRKDAKNIYPSKNQAEASIALAQLLQLRDVYRNGWKPNWTNKTQIYYITLESNKWFVFRGWTNNKPFAFQTAEIRDLFFENFKDLLEEVKPLFE